MPDVPLLHRSCSPTIKFLVRIVSAMKNGLKIASVMFVAVLLALIASYLTSEDREDSYLEATITEGGLRGLGLDITPEDMESIGAYPGCDLRIYYGEHECVTAIYTGSHGGVPSFGLYVRYSERSGSMSIGIEGGDLAVETGLASGDVITMKVIGENKLYKLTPHFRAGSTDKRADYDDDQKFGNYREMKGGNLKEDTFYRSSNPWNYRSERAEYSDNFYREIGVENLICFDLDMERVAERCEKLPEAYATSLYEKGNVHAEVLSPSVHSHPDQARFVLESLLDTEGSVGMFCTYGRDRTGAYCAMIEALAGASFEEIRADYMESLCNYYHFEKDTPEYEAVAKMYVDRVLYLYKHPEYIGHYLSVDWSRISFDDYVPEEVFTNYLINVCGLSSELIDAVKERITA